MDHPLKIAFQMDPVTAVDINADTTFRLAEEAQARGYDLYCYQPEQLVWHDGQVLAHDATPFAVQRVPEDHVHLGATTELDITSCDVVWLRQDPPFDMQYVTTTHLLDHLRGTTLVVNDPFWVRNYPEKLLVLQFPDLLPPTVISRDLGVIREFRAKHGEIIIKPLYGNGGVGVFRLGRDDPNLAALHEQFMLLSREPLIAQKYLAEVAAGDKRIILVDGAPIGAINRIPRKGEARSNLHAGGRPEKSGLTARDREICSTVGPLLREKGQILVGMDVIGGCLTEINLTSPTGLQELERFDFINAAALVWDAVEARLGVG